MFFYSFRHDLLHSNGTWTVSLSGRHTHKRVHITRVAPAGLPDSDLPQKVVCDPTEKRYISGILSGTLVETSGVSDFLATLALARWQHQQMKIIQPQESASWLLTIQ